MIETLVQAPEIKH